MVLVLGFAACKSSPRHDAGIVGPGDAQESEDAGATDATMHGRDAIRSWISETMSTYPGNAMPAFPIGWSVIDEEKGWVICQVWNRMEDPGDGSTHQAYNVTILKYAGDGRWSYEEDIYNPAHFASMIEEWERRKAELTGS